jgi:hypothetical protein
MKIPQRGTLTTGKSSSIRSISTIPVCHLHVRVTSNDCLAALSDQEIYNAVISLLLDKVLIWKTDPTT